MINQGVEQPDLSSCDREAIHIPGSVQPHGMLLSLEDNTWRIVQASRNMVDAFGIEAEKLVGTPVCDLFDQAQAQELCDGLNNPFLERNPLYVSTVRIPGRQGRTDDYRAIAHRYKGALILELERAVSTPVTFQNLYPLVASFLSRLEEVRSVTEACQLAAEETRRITGFGRVLVYRFDVNWHGQVIAEARSDEFAPYMDLWFPASDIPAQARELYRLNRLRLIADSDYRPSPLMPALDPRTGQPLDLSYSTLRSVSPVHVEYLKNMDVMASMSISIIRDGALWGLIAMHNKTPLVAPYEARLACDLLGQTLSTRLAAQENKQEYEHRLHLKSIITKLLGFMAEAEPFINGLTNHPDELLAFGDAAGAAVLFEGRCTLVGATPSAEEVWRITDWLAEQGNEEVFCTDHLALQLAMPWLAASPSAAEDELRATEAGGVLAVSISKFHKSYLLWFRPEVISTVKWGGDPRKAVEAEAGAPMRVHPRKSFEVWKQTVRGRSIPWRSSEVESAGELRNAVVGIVLRKAEEMAALSAELERSNKELEAFSYSVSHDLRAPFRHIAGYTELLTDHLGATADETAARYLTRISGAAESAGQLVDHLLNFSRIGRSKLTPTSFSMGKLVGEVKQEFFREEEERSVKWSIAELPEVKGDPVLLRMVWQNYMSNALKYTRNRAEAEILIGYEATAEEFIFFVRDNGAGFNQRYVDKLFGVFQRLHSDEEFEGTGIGLANVRRAVGRHGGRTWAEGKAGVGAAFYFSLPRRLTGERSN